VLVGVAVSAVTGCLTVRGKPEPHRSPDAGPSRLEESPEPAGVGPEPRMARPSLREGLSRPVPERSGPHDAAPGTGTAPGAAEDTRSEQGRRPAARGSDGPGRRAAVPRGSGGVPEPRDPVVRSGGTPELPGDAGVCDLGRRYGGWAAGSAQQQACQEAYGR
jgi:hypothetical protein